MANPHPFSPQESEIPVGECKPPAFTELGLETTLTSIRGVLQAEADALLAGAERLGVEAADAVNLLLSKSRGAGRVVVTGLGKAGCVARKAAATFCSTGTPALFLHPSEALHGDIGSVTEGDVLIAISNSGETDEVLAMLPYMARRNVPVIAITGNRNSSLASRSAIVIDAGVESEADPISLAPTSSTTLSMAMCDALAIALMTHRGFTREQFAIYHPGGSIGRKLLLKVSDLMRTGDRVPFVSADEKLQVAISTITEKKMGAAFVVNSDRVLSGILTDGDLRRWYQKHPGKSVGAAEAENPAIAEKMPLVKNVMTVGAKQIESDALAAEALRMMEDHQITILAVVDPEKSACGNSLVGAIHLHDLIRAGLS